MLLTDGYAVLAKDYSIRRSARLAHSVTHWHPDPKVPGREVGWVTHPPTAYVRPVRQIAVRCRATAEDAWQYGVLIGPPDLAAVWSIRHGDAPRPTAEDAQVLAYVYAYDARGGGVETSFKEDKQGLGLTTRQKKRFAAQQVLTLLGSLAHTVCVWVRAWLSAQPPSLRRYGLKRLVRDIFQIAGRIRWDATGQIVQIILNQAAPLVQGVVHAFQSLLAHVPIGIRLGET